MNDSLAKIHPELVSEWSEKNLPLTPDDITFGSNKKVWWKGACGHEWKTSVKARSNGEKCPICSGARVIAGINDLATLEPLLEKQWSDRNYPLLPTQVMVFANRKAWWKCKDCGREWNTLAWTVQTGLSQTGNGKAALMNQRREILSGGQRYNRPRWYRREMREWHSLYRRG